MPGLDGLRGLAIIAMLAYHNEFGWAQGGFLGLSLFFALSGFLITSLLLREQREFGSIDLAAFWWRRFRRLAPAALLALAFVVLYGAVAATASQRADLAGDVRASVLYVANWRMLAGGHSYAAMFASSSPIQHFWSLAVEEQFYFVFPLVAALVLVATRGSRKAFGATLGVLMVASLTMQLVSSGHDRIYYGTDTRASEFLAGALLAVWMAGWKPELSKWRQVAIAIVGAAGLVLTLWMWHRVALASAWLYHGGFVATGLLSAVIVTAAIMPGPVRTIASFRPFRAIGLISYGLYLFHWPIFLWLNGPRTGLAGVELFTVRMTATTIVAVLSYYFVEQPIRTGRWVARPRAFWPACVAAAIAVMVAATVVVPVPRASQVITTADFAAASKVLARDSSSPASSRRSTAVGAVPKPLRIFVVGDSTGLLFAAGLDAWGKANGRAVVASDAFLDCPLARGGSFRHGSAENAIPVSQYCDTISDDWPKTIAKWHPDVVLVMGGPSTLTDRRPPGASQWYTIGDPTWDSYLWSELNRDADLLTARGVPVLWFDQFYLQRDGGASTGRLDAWSDPARANAYNKMVARLDASRTNIVRFPWARFFNRMSVAKYTSLVPDGVHVDAEVMPTLLDHEGLWTKLQSAYLTARTQVQS
jgi:peptidoglycan/LPS O-acetylase OafA/YrhL